MHPDATRPHRGPRPIAKPPLLLLVVLALVAAACSREDETPTRPDGGPAPVEAAQPEGPPARTEPPAFPDAVKDGPWFFEDRTLASGIRFLNRSGTRDKLAIPENIGQGAMFFDYDGDGDLDIYFANGGLIVDPERGRFRNALYRNEGDWTFVDVTEGSGLECPTWSAGVYTFDHDADGWPDVYVTQLGPNKLFRNLGGTGRFEDVTDTVGGGDAGFGASAAFFDADADGDLDLYVCNYVEYDPMNPPNGGVPCEWRTLQVACGPRGLPEQRDAFYENVDGKLVPAVSKFGFDDPRSANLAKGGYSLGVVTGDFDGDGDPDVYVAVDSRPNFLFENLGGGKFREVATEWQTALNADAVEQAGMGVAAGDVNDDGATDLFVTNFSHDTNTLYVNAGGSGERWFEDRTTAAGLGGQASYPFLSWGTGIFDFDCDGLLDIMVASGHVYPQAEGRLNLGTTYPQPNQLFIARDRNLNFHDVGPRAGPVFADKRVSRGTSFADLDRDGRIDVLITQLDDFPVLARNACDIRGSWFALELATGDARNPSGIGARGVLEFEDGRRLHREIFGGGGFLGDMQRFLHWSWGADATPKRLSIVWPDGTTAAYEAPAAGSWYRLEKDGGAFTALPAR